MATVTKDELESLRRRMLATGLDVVSRIFPQKIIELDRIIQTNVPPIQELDLSISSPHTSLFTEKAVQSPRKKRKYMEKDGDLDSSQRIGIRGSDPLVPSEGQEQTNVSKITCSSRPKPSAHKTLHDIIKKESADMIQLTDQARIWLILTHPTTSRTEEDLLAELHLAQESALNIRSLPGKDYLTRAKLCSKLVKYPTVEDYQNALQEHDEQHLHLAHQCLYDIRNIYIVLVEIIKTIETQNIRST